MGIEIKRKTWLYSSSVELLLFSANMSNLQQNLQAAQNEGQAKADEWAQSTKDTANAARDKTADATNSAKESAQQGKDSSAGFLNQTGGQMKNMAQGAVDNVKNTLGMGDKK